MTKIFEALENAGLDRYKLPENEEKIISIQQRRKTPNVQNVETTVRTFAETEVNTASRLYQSIIMLLPDQESRIVQFQGTQRGEGTSTLVRELASFAAIKLKKNVLLLDLNQTTPNQCSYFNVHSQLPPLDSPHEVQLKRDDFARIDNSSLYVTQLPVQGIPANIICELPEICPMLEELKKEFDLILIDSPAAINRSQCIMLSPMVNGVVLVVEAGKTRWQTIDTVKEHILAQDGNILGVALNKRRYPIPDYIYKRI